MTDGVSNIFSALGTLALIVLIFIGAYWFTKLLGKHYGGRATGTSSSMKVLERMSLGSNCGLIIVRIHDKVLLLGITQQQITLLQELDAEQYPDKGPSTAPMGKGQFSEILKKSLKTFGFPIPNKPDKRRKGP